MRMSGFAPLKRMLRRFLKSDRGTILPFTMTVLILIVMMGALAVNTIRLENKRSSMQATLDICVLNTAALKQTLDEKDVFYDCVAKNGMEGSVTDLTISEGFSSKSVSATGQIVMDPFFLHNINKLAGNTPYDRQIKFSSTSAAREKVGNVEISLVLDISGSMAGTRMTRMQEAAREFVATMLNADTEQRVSITLVPYNGQVNLGPDLAAKFNITDLPAAPGNNPNLSNSRCVDLPPTAYNSTAMSRTVAMPATTFADTFSPTNQTTSFVSLTDSNNSTGATVNPANIWCPNSAANHVRLPDFTAPTQQSTVDNNVERITALNNRITAMTAVGATSINAGMRWGLAFLDPAANSIFSEFALAGQMPERWASRPMPFGDPDVMKVVVLMSDGENFAEERVNRTTAANFKSGPSTIWRGNDGNVSIFHAGVSGNNKFWVPHNGTWRATAWRNSTNTGADAVNMDWQTVWRTWRTSYVAWQFYARGLGGLSGFGTRSQVYTNTMNAFRTLTPTATMDSQLQAACAMGRSADVVIFTIAYEAPTNGQTQLRNCVGNDTSRYFVASSTTIRAVLGSIASNISKLRLTQ